MNVRLSVPTAKGLTGDKLRSAPDRINPAGLVALSAGICGAALACDGVRVLEPFSAAPRR